MRVQRHRRPFSFACGHMQMRCRTTPRASAVLVTRYLLLLHLEAHRRHISARKFPLRIPDRKRNNKALMQGLHGSLRKTHFGDMMLVLV
jgi:hypothetical protein